jgi:hypothetical protein
MAIKSKGRGTAAAFGLLLVISGLFGGGVLYWQSVNRTADVVDGFARAPIGCTTTLRFTETGTFYVFEDIGPLVAAPAGVCEPSADPDQTFAFELSGPDGPVVPKPEQGLSYDTEDHVGSSVARFEVTALGEYEIVVVGDDESVVAAIGRDPDDGVDDLRQRAIVVAIVGVVLGALLLVLAGHRSKHAATFATPDGPGWGPQPTPDDHLLAHDRSAADRSAVNPHQPDEQVAIARPLSDVNEMLAQPPVPKPASPWGPPVASEAAPDQPAVAPVDADEDERAAGGLTDPGLTDPGLTDAGLTDPGLTDPGLTDPGADEPTRSAD